MVVRLMLFKQISMPDTPLGGKGIQITENGAAQSSTRDPMANYANELTALLASWTPFQKCGDGRQKRLELCYTITDFRLFLFLSIFF